MKKIPVAALLFSSLWLYACSGNDANTNGTNSNPDLDNTNATVRAVLVSGESGQYTFSVTLDSPDTGCEQYADWWEVLRADGSLVYRRILTHSHVDEQPFTRSGGPVEIVDNENIFVRAHMNHIGYSEHVFSGSVEQGLIADTLSSSFMQELAFIDPLPADCAF